MTRPAFYFFLLLAATLLAGPNACAYQVILDGEDSNWRTMSPAWQLDKTGSYHLFYKFSAAGPGTGTNQCAWDIDAIPAGTYDVDFYVDTGNYAADAQYIVEHDGGITTVTRSQNFVSTGWHNLGTFDFTHAGRVTQTDYWTGAGTKVISDALRITLQGEPALPPAGSVPPEVAIVMDDLGGLNPNNAASFAYSSLRDSAPVTYAVLPGRPYSNAVLQVAEANNKQSILHQPLQYIGQPDSNPSDMERLYISMNAGQIVSVLNNNINPMLPYIWGINNHQGSRFSQYTAGMHTVLNHLKSQNMFYLDSRTISDSVSYNLSRQKGMLSAERDSFVDGNTNAHTRQLINDVGVRALYAPNYEHVMICHERQTTYLGLGQAVQDMQTSGITVKKLDRALHYIMEVDDAPAGAYVETSGAWTTTTLDMISHECTDGVALEADNGTSATVAFHPNLPKAGNYRLFVGAGWSGDARGNNRPRVTLTSTRGDANITINQAENRNRWVYCGAHAFDSGLNAIVTLQTANDTGGKTYADAIKFVYDGPIDSAGIDDWKTYAY